MKELHWCDRWLSGYPQRVKSKCRSRCRPLLVFCSGAKTPPVRLYLLKAIHQVLRNGFFDPCLGLIVPLTQMWSCWRCHSSSRWKSCIDARDDRLVFHREWSPRWDDVVRTVLCSVACYANTTVPTIFQSFFSSVVKVLCTIDSYRAQWRYTEFPLYQDNCHSPRCT